jgi:predicted metal-dependent hydrolase
MSKSLATVVLSAKRSLAGGAANPRGSAKWGSRNPKTRSIRLNTEIAKKPRRCLEYLVVHEMVHMREPTHNARFVALMDRVMPHWDMLRAQLNRLPVRHDEWRY